MTMGKKKKGSGLGCLFWIALILLVLVIFLFNRERIRTVVESTGLRDLLADNFTSTEKPEVTRVETSPEDDSPRGSSEQKTREDATPRPRNATPDAGPQEKDTELQERVVTIESEPQNTRSVESTEKNAVSESADSTYDDGSNIEKPVETDERVRNMRKAKLYFVSLNESGEILLESIVRPVFYIDSPLTETMESLLKGLTTSELNQGLLSLIPEEAVLHSVKVSGGIAYIDFSQAIRFNAFGKEGYVNQLKQLIYTATEFPTVNAVQIMIEGKVHSYMGPEGVYIGEPLTRESF